MKKLLPKLDLNPRPLFNITIGSHPNGGDRRLNVSTVDLPYSNFYLILEYISI